MGLDQYLYRVSKIGDGLAKRLEGKNTSDVSGYFILGREYIEDEEIQRTFKDLLPYFTKVRMLRTEIDLDRIRRDNGIPQDAYWIDSRHVGNERSEITFALPDGTDKTVEWDAQRYTFEEPFDAYVCQKEEVYYWRKAYDVQDYIYDALKPTDVENCGYYLLSPDIINDMVERGFIDYCFDDSGDIFYHEWY